MNKIFLLLFFTAVTYAAPVLNVDKELINFDNLSINQVISKNIKIQNIGDSKLEILNIFSSCKCLSWKLQNKSIIQREDANLSLTVDSTGITGKKEVFLILQTNDPKKSLFKIAIKINIALPDKPVISLSPQTLTFQLFDKQTSKAKLMVKNLGEETLIAEFDNLPKSIKVDNQKFSVNQEEKKLITFTYFKNQVKGEHITLRSNDKDKQTIKIPIIIKES